MSGGSAAVVLLGSSGGCGTTTLAIGIALAIVRDGRASVLLELDLARGDMAGAMGVPRDRTLADLDGVANELTHAQVASAAHAHRSGIRILFAPGSPTARRWQPSEGGRLLHAATRSGAVVADASAGLSGVVEGVVQAGARPLVLTPRSRAGARRASALVASLPQADDAALVITQGPGPVEMSARSVQRMVGVRVLGALPRSEEEAAQLAVGRWPTRRRAKLARAVASIAGQALT